METSDHTANKSILLSIAEKLTLAQQELDELAVQLALGKADATDTFEKMKKEFRIRLAELSNILEARSDHPDDAGLKAKVAALQAELEAGKASTRSLFETQHKKLLAALKTLEETITNKFIRHPRVSEIISDLEKFKLMLEIMRLKFVLKKFILKDNFKSGMKEASAKISKLLTNTEGKMKQAKESASDFRSEIQEAYRHIKKAVHHI